MATALAAYGICQTGCNTAWVACCSALGYIAGTFTLGTIPSRTLAIQQSTLLITAQVLELLQLWLLAVQYKARVWLPVLPGLLALVQQRCVFFFICVNHNLQVATAAVWMPVAATASSVVVGAASLFNISGWWGIS
jgi:hypothetical protein